MEKLGKVIVPGGCVQLKLNLRTKWLLPYRLLKHWEIQRGLTFLFGGKWLSRKPALGIFVWWQLPVWEKQWKPEGNEWGRGQGLWMSRAAFKGPGQNTLWSALRDGKVRVSEQSNHLLRLESCWIQDSRPFV